MVQSSWTLSIRAVRFSIATASSSRFLRSCPCVEERRQRTCEGFGFPVNLHRFRHAAATFWSISDPKNVRGAKDLLGHSSFGTTEKHYVMAQSRLAGRALARAIGNTRK